MEQIIYTSIAAPDLDAGDIFKIVETAARNNADRQITGLLVFAEDRFFQAIEGPGLELDRLLAALKRDRRHHSIRIVSRRSITTRQFKLWRTKRLIVGDAQGARREFAHLLAKHPEADTVLGEFEKFLRIRRFAA